MIEDFFENIVKKLPKVKITIPGARGWVLQGPESQVVFFEIEKSVTIPSHSHGPQFGFIIEGEAILNIGGKSGRLTAGTSYYIPAGTMHDAAFGTFTRAVDFFMERNRYEIEE
ncbi:MAG: cupin domain-containing protein [Candidatus Thorarchaeota archaeon]|jgi:quercetin dioxygenase-like cupin family protein